MIRLPVSSISLSENDLSFHLQQIEIYHGLLKQGFRKKDIIRYFKEHQEASAHSSTNAEDSQTIESAPSCVELALRSQSSIHASPPDPRNQGRKSSTQSEGENSSESTAEDAEATVLADPCSPTTAPSQPPHRHAPRQSSLLRFAKAVSSDSPDEAIDATRVLRPPARTYRPRSETYSYDQSEISETDLANGLQELYISPHLHNHDELVPPGARSTSPMRPEAESFVPQDSAMQRLTQGVDAFVEQDRQIADRLTSGGRRLAQVPSIGTQIPESVLTPRRSSLGATSIAHPSSNNSSSPRGHFPSSPPSPQVQALRQSGPSPTLPTMPTTPTQARHNPRHVWTEPRSQGLDGSFAVYNDSLPANAQPRTPADLSRRYHITERDAAYTAPVGMINTPTTSRYRRIILGELPEFGEQSPTTRAIGIRERRARELVRSVRAEGQRLERLRRQDRERLEGNDANDDAAGPERGRARDGPGPAIFDEPWMDELEGDRVGDENWEGEIVLNGVGRERVVRVTSGNANGGRGI